MVNRVSNDQLDLLLNFLVEHPSLARGVVAPRSKNTVEGQWNDLARKLNSFVSGSSKTGDRWKKYWIYIKHKTKIRLAKWRMDAQSAGGALEDISDIDKKILAIIGAQAVFGDNQHGVPVFNIQPAFQDTATVQPDNFIEVSKVSKEVVISDTSEFPEPAADLEVQIQQTPEPHQTGLESPVSQAQPARRRLRPRHRRTSLNSNSTIFLQQWAKELEKNRVQAEKKMAAATFMFAEAASKIAEASLMNAETNRMNAETNRKQFEVMKALIDVVGQPGQPSSARLRAKDQSENEFTVFCPKCNTEVLGTLKQEEARNADKRLEPPEKLFRARKRSRQTDSSSETDSSDDNDDEQSSKYHDDEPEIELGPASVKVEPIDIEDHKEHAHTDPISLDVKTEPRDDEVDNTNEALIEPTGTKRKGRKIPRRRSDVTSTRRSMFGATEIKKEQIEIHEEGFS